MDYKEIIRSYFREHSIVESQINSYNYFIEKRLKEIIMNFRREDIPEYLLEVYDEVNLKGFV